MYNVFQILLSSASLCAFSLSQYLGDLGRLLFIIIIFRPDVDVVQWMTVQVPLNWLNSCTKEQASHFHFNLVTSVFCFDTTA